MADYKLDAAYEIRRYLWEELQSHNIFDLEDYYSENIGDTIVPIIPVQQQPELNQFLSGKKHIVYDKIGLVYDDNWLICNEKFLFTIYATDVDQINEIRNLMVDIFRRMDESARDLNSSKASDKFIFHNSLVLEITSISPSDELQGFMSSDVILEVKYSRLVDPSGRFS